MRHNEKAHRPTAEYKCKACDMSFKSEQESMDHNRKMHPMPQQAVKELKCQACGMAFKSESELMEHSRKMHQTAKM